MKQLLKISILILLACSFLLTVACSKNVKSKNGNGKKAEEIAIPVEVAQVKMGDIAAYFSGTATIEAEEETEVVAKVGEVVKEIQVEEGDYVQTGQVLARLDDARLKVQLEQAQANLAKLENGFQRSQELYNKNLISAEDFQRAKYEYDSQKAAFNLVRLELDYTAIRAPISGVIAERMIKIGNMVLPNQATFRITGFNPLLAELYVPERQISKLQEGHTAALKVDAIDGNEFKGVIKRISPVVDPTTGTVKVTVEVKDVSRRLKPGMFTRVNITHDVHQNTLLVPKDALIEEDKETTVFVVRDSIAYRQIVNIGYQNGANIEILSGLQAGDSVVTIGKGSLKDSAKVELVRIVSMFVKN